MNDPVFKNGFENGQFAKAASTTGAKAVLPSKGATLSLAVSYPTDGLTTGTPYLQVYGTYSGPPNTGVSVQGGSALVTGSSYLQMVKLKPGSNGITILATTSAGATQTIARTVTFLPGDAPDVTVDTAFTGDYAPFSLRFSVTARAGIANPNIQRIRIDYDGNGSFDTDVTDLTTRLVGRYNSVGLYSAVIEVTLDDGETGTPPQIVTVTKHVLAEDLDVTRQTLCATFESFRSNLSVNQVTSALNSFSPDVRADYQSFFAGLGSNAATVANAFGEVVDGTIGQELSTLIISRPIPGQPSRYHGFSIQFGREHDGVWRITAL